jgi:pimeloyl-ACP methyl ester carboxylesterase
MRFRAVIACVVFVLAACQGLPPASGMHAVGPEGPPDGRWREQIHWLPVGDRRIQARLCRPERQGPAPLVVINHGSPPNPAQRAGMRPGDCDNEAVSWFLLRGHAVLLPLRRGYGASGGDWAEGYGRCGDADFAAAGRETARDILAAVDYGTRLPGIRPEGVIVVGQSAGGWGSLALAAMNPGQVARVVNMAGGRGGWAQGMPNTNCRPDRLVSGAAEFGRTARLRTLWIYTANDSFFGPELAAQMHAAFTEAGGAAQMHALEPWGRDGHLLFGGDGGTAVWGPILEAWLAGG